MGDRPDAGGAIRAAEVVVPTTRFDEDLKCFTEAAGFRLDRIWPADAPDFAALSGHGAALLLARAARAAPVTVRLHTTDGNGLAGGGKELVTPGGHRIEAVDAEPPVVIPEPVPEFSVHRLTDEGAWGVGRAGMRYRDLLPGRLGGAMIASHIRIPDAGPVPDMVHYHEVAFQLIFCHRGWVRVAYEDQGPPFALRAGDCVIQPPRIRHRVLEASAGMEVVEIGVPAEHLTTIDHEMDLPTGRHRPERDFSGTRFLRRRASEANWTRWRIPGFEMRETGIAEATGGLAGVQVARRVPGRPPPPSARHGAEILFGFVRSGSLTLIAGSREPEPVEAGGSFVLPKDLDVAFSEPSDDLEILEVTLPGAFPTTLAGS